MELISGLRTEYLLDASLETLHAESTEWLNEIDFWNEEMSFFYKLIHTKETHFSFPTTDLAQLEKEMIKITAENLIEIKIDIQSHERTLSALIRNTAIGEERDYRKKHRELMISMSNTLRLIRQFKRKVFSFIQ